MSKLKGRLALLFSLVGFGALVSAAYIHYRLLYDPTYTSFCDAGGALSCSQVYQSQFSTVWGIPVAVFGAIWFAGAILLSVSGLLARPAVRERIPGYLFALSTPALGASLYLLYVSIFVLEAFCLMCLVTDAAVIGLFLVSGAAAVTVPMLTLPRHVVRDLRVLAGSPLAVTVTVLFLLGSASTLAFFPREAGAEAGPQTLAAANAAAASELERFMAAAPRVPLVVPSEGAKVLIVKFNDFQCPACGHSYLVYKPILAKYEVQAPGAVRVVLKDYPLNPSCNASSSMVHAAACDAAVAVRLAREHGRGVEMEDWLYTHQPSMTPASVRQAAREVGQVPDFDARYAATLELVKSDVALGRQLGIRSTPTFFINGVKVEGEWQTQYFDQAIAYELARATPK